MADLPDVNAPLSDYERALLEKLLSDPTQLPSKFKSWMADYVASNGSFHVESVASLESVLVPVGGIVAFGGATPPDSFLLCDGSAVSRADYAKLFAQIGTNFGSGDGSTTFNIPSIKGKTIVGRDSGDADWDTLGETRGAKTHTLSTAEIPSHTHPDPGQQYATTAAVAQTASGGSFAAINGFSSVTGAAGGGGAHNNIQPSIVLNYIIRAA